jgi:hypothetical protein
VLPYGLRTVDGTWNNLLPGMERLGAADNVMPRLVPVNLQGPYAAPTASNMVVDPQVRIISNLIVDQTGHNIAAFAAQDRADESTFPGLDVVQESANGTLFIPNQSPDIGLSAPFNGVMTFFGQFFDHGLDLITKGNGIVFVPLMPDDPLYVKGSPTNFMVLSRAMDTVGPAPTACWAMPTTTPQATPTPRRPSSTRTRPTPRTRRTRCSCANTCWSDGKPVATGNLLDNAPAKAWAKAPGATSRRRPRKCWASS